MDMVMVSTTVKALEFAKAYIGWRHKREHRKGVDCSGCEALALIDAELARLRAEGREGTSGSRALLGFRCGCGVVREGDVRYEGSQPFHATCGASLVIEPQPAGPAAHAGQRPAAPPHALNCGSRSAEPCDCGVAAHAGQAPLIEWAARLVRAVCGSDDEGAEPVRAVALEMKAFHDAEPPERKALRRVVEAWRGLSEDGWKHDDCDDEGCAYGEAERALAEAERCLNP